MSATSTESPLPPKEIGCHRTGFARTCRELVSAGVCNRWTAETMTDHTTGRVHARHDCLDNWQVQYLKDNARHQNQTGAAIESFRNEVAAINGFPDGHPDVPRLRGPSRSSRPDGAPSNHR